MKLHRDWKPLARELKAAGCELEPGGKHIKVKRDGKTVGSLPHTPGDHRALLNTRSFLRSKGVLK